MPAQTVRARGTAIAYLLPFPPGLRHLVNPFKLVPDNRRPLPKTERDAVELVSASVMH